jgi:hypothetical protein
MLEVFLTVFHMVSEQNVAVPTPQFGVIGSG